MQRTWTALSCAGMVTGVPGMAPGSQAEDAPSAPEGNGGIADGMQAGREAFMANDVPPFVVTLVHGTFARGAAWANDESAFIRRRLCERFGEAVRFRAFNWSGANSHPARWRGAEELRCDQEALARDQPGLRRFVVAHSHGGNVALYALGDASSSSGLAGIVTMGTPFIACGPRSIQAGMVLLRLGLPFMALLVGALLLGIVGVIASFALQPLLSSTAWTIAALVFVLYGTTAVINLAFWVFRSMPRLEASLAARQQVLLARLRLPAPVPMLCVHVSGDEAGRWLGLTRWLAELPYLVWRRRTLLAVLALLGVSTYVAMLGGIEGHGRIQSHLIAAGIGAMVSGVTALMYGVYWQLVMAGVPLLIRAHRGAYGGEGVFHNWLLRIRTTVVPATADDRVTAHACAVPSGTRGLKHSWMYGDEAVIDAIADWMYSRLAGGAKR